MQLKQARIWERTILWKKKIWGLPAAVGGSPVRETKIYYGHQYLDEADYQAVLDVLKSDALTCGPKIGELEERLCSITGAKHAVSVSNGTAALHIACLLREWARGMR